MKKVLCLFFAVTCVLLLASCNKNDFSLEVKETSNLREKVVFSCELTDPNDDLANSELTYKVCEKETGDQIDSGTITISADNSGTFTSTGLESGVTYTLTVVTGYNGKEVTLVSKEFTTTEGGVESNPYLIHDAAEFESMLENDPSGYFKLANDIDFEGLFYDPLFTSSVVFAGTLDGDGHTIKNFKTTVDTQETVSKTYQGILGYIGSDGVVKNLVIDGFEVNLYYGSQCFFAAIAGYNAGLVENVKLTNSTIKASGSSLDYFMGGIVAYNAVNGVVRNCEVTDTVQLIATSNRSFFVGGIVAKSAAISVTYKENVVESCKFAGNIEIAMESRSTTAYQTNIVVGGIIGQNFSVVKDCEATGTIKVTSGFSTVGSVYNIVVGGIAGENMNNASKVTNDTADVSFDITSYDAKNITLGLIVGQNGGSNASYSSQVKGNYTNSGKDIIIRASETATINVGLVGVDKAIKYTNAEVSADTTVVVEKYTDGEITGNSDVTISK